ncbi:MAG: alpha/beta hydrolase [Fibrobacteria bacterium]
MKKFQAYRVAMSLFFPVLMSAADSALAQPVELLWPQGAPGATGTADADKPTLTLFPVAGAKANGAAVLICPGGGYTYLEMSKEGSQAAKWMNELGISAFVLKSRLGPNYHHPIEMNDAKRAMRWVRANAKRFNIDAKRVGIVGFSAGGHLASTVATHFDAGDAGAQDSIDRFSCRPDFQVLVYPVITMDASFTHAGSRTALLGNNPSADLVTLLSNEKQVTAESPPGFLTAAKDDGTVPIKNSQLYFDALVKAKVPAKFKIFDTGGHGFGLGVDANGKVTNATIATWPVIAGQWLDSLGFFKTAVTGVRTGAGARASAKEHGSPGGTGYRTAASNGSSPGSTWVSGSWEATKRFWKPGAPERVDAVGRSEKPRR